MVVLTAMQCLHLKDIHYSSNGRVHWDRVILHYNTHHNLRIRQRKAHEKVFKRKISVVQAASKESRENKVTKVPTISLLKQEPADDASEKFEIANFLRKELKSFSKNWEYVPWSGKEAAVGIVSVVASFLGVGLVFIPLMEFTLGREAFDNISSQEKSVLLLLNQTLVTAIGLSIIHSIIRKYRPLPVDVLSMDWRNPFDKHDGWAIWGIAGIVASPAFVYLASVISTFFGMDNLASPGTVDTVSDMLGLDTLTFFSLMTTTSVLAPLFEETLFRGFLLPSLAQVMPVPAAVALSSLAFSLAHLSPRDAPQLLALGMLLGLVYIRSKNLLSPIVVHGVWNGTVIAILYFLQSQGVDIARLLHEGGI